jgi:hypothetical protein
MADGYSTAPIDNDGRDKINAKEKTTRTKIF